MDPVGTLHRTLIFKDVPALDLEELLPDLRERRLARGEIVWHEGDPATDLCVVADGQLKVSRVNPDGREVIVDVVSAGASTGDVGLFHPRGIRWLSLTAMTPASCLLLRRAPLLSFLHRHPQAMLGLLEQLSVAAVNMANAFSGVAFDDIRRRVASTLLHLARSHGERTSDGIRIGVRLSQGDLAAQVAATRENVNRALSLFVSGGVVSHRAGYFWVHDLDALARTAGEEPAGRRW